MNPFRLTLAASLSFGLVLLGSLTFAASPTQPTTLTAEETQLVAETNALYLGGRYKPEDAFKVVAAFERLYEALSKNHGEGSLLTVDAAHWLAVFYKQRGDKVNEAKWAEVRYHCVVKTAETTDRSECGPGFCLALGDLIGRSAGRGS